MKKTILFLLLFSLSSLVFCISQEEAKIVFDQGNKAYETGKYDEALASYKQLEKDFVSFDLFYNIGNTYYKLNNNPQAILYYERAKKIDPSNEDLKTNLQIANTKVVDKIDKLPTLAITDFGNSFVSKEKLSLWAWGSILSLFVAFFLFILYFKNRSSSKSRSPLIIGLLFVFLTLITFGIGQYGVSQISGGQDAIIISPKVDVLNQPNGDQTVFVLHAGTKVHVRNKQNKWIEIKIDNGSVGWIESKECEEI